MQRVRNLHGSDVLLISADRGTHQLQDLAVQHEPHIARHSSFSLPVNYHALASLLRAQGGRYWTNHHGSGLAILAAVCGRHPKDQARHWPETAHAAQSALQQFNPNDFYHIKRALEDDAAYLTPEQMLAYLRFSQWDTKIFYLFFPHLQGQLAALNCRQQSDWFQALDAVWTYHLPIGEDYDLAFDLATLAAELQRWSVRSRKTPSMTITW